MRTAELFFRGLADAEDKPCRPERQEQRGHRAPGDVEIMQGQVVHVAKKVGLNQLPDGEDDSDDADAREGQGDPEPSSLLTAMRHVSSPATCGLARWRCTRLLWAKHKTSR